MRKKEIRSLIIAFLIGIVLWFLPHSANVPDKGWQLFTIFITTIIGIILKPMPMGAIAVVGMAVALATQTLTLEETLAGFHNDVAWLVVFAFYIALGFIKTGLGTRIAYFFVGLFGKRTLGLSYALLSSELILAPAIPSVTARAGGVIYPIIQSLAKTFGSSPVDGTERLMGSFLIKVAYQGSTITSAMFLTGMAANPFLIGLTADAGYTVTWGMWALAAIVPGLLTLIVMPYIVYKIYPPTITQTPHAPAIAKQKLKEMGRFSVKEWVMLSIFSLLLVLWVFGAQIGIKAASAAAIGLALLLLFNIIEWKDVVQEDKAWDTFMWLSILIMMATALNRLGFTPWFSEQIVGLVQGLNWVYAFLVLLLIYYYSHYFFASNTAHVGAMYPAFLMAAVGLGTPPFLAILAMAFSTDLMGGLTHYGSGPAPLYYGSGYVDVKSWWRVGFILSIVYLIIWIGLGSAWWKVLGLW